MSLLRAAAEISLSSIASSSLYVGLITLAILGIDDGPTVEVGGRPRAAVSGVDPPGLGVGGGRRENQSETDGAHPAYGTRGGRRFQHLGTLLRLTTVR